MAAALKATAAGWPSPPSRHASRTPGSPDQDGHICSRAVAAQTARPRGNDGQIADGPGVAGQQDPCGLATGASRRGGSGGPGRDRRPAIATERSIGPRARVALTGEQVPGALGLTRPLTDGRLAKKTACGVVSLRRHCPDQVPGGRRSASQLSALSAFPSRLRLPGGWCGPAPSITSQTMVRLHGAKDGRLGPKAPACTGPNVMSPAQATQRSGPVPGAPCTAFLAASPRPPPGSAQSGSAAQAPAASHGGGVYASRVFRAQDHSLTVAASGLPRIERFPA